MMSAKLLTFGCIFLLGLSCWLGSERTAASPIAADSEPLNTPQISASSPCSVDLPAGIICPAANEEGLRLLRQRGFAGAIVVQDVRSGALVAYASLLAIDANSLSGIRSSNLEVTSPILPLSVSKVFLAASWWDHEAEVLASNACKSKKCMSDTEVHEMFVSGSDSVGKKLALELRQGVGGEKVLNDLGAYGFPAKTANHPAADEHFWGFIEPGLRGKLTPTSAYTSVRSDAADDDWASAFSIGEAGFSLTALHISRFMQAVGNGGVMLPPSARTHVGAAAKIDSGKRVMRNSTAERLISGMLDNVQRGTTEGIRGRMSEKWKIGGKTGTNSAADGIFSGLVCDAHDVPQFSFATFIKGGGKGGGVAAEISADLMKFIVGN
jgi:cell division protein FtsI/penicillin-binding protein 2